MYNAPPVRSVTQLNQEIRTLLEEGVGEVAVEGEISTLSKPSSGHYYFTLKDKSAQLRCVFFRNRKKSDTDAIVATGQQVVAYGHLSLYEARGDYQLIVENLEAAGQGELYRQFELLKTKLAAMGLFEALRKKSLPRFPRAIGIVSSTSGAALHDMLTTLSRRYPLASILVYPSEVQGTGAAKQLINALNKANKENRSDVILLARGGGSIEDLWAFNDEQLAHTIANSAIPIVTGIGHETDFTIADFVADFRAATPTAAAETVSPDQAELLSLINTLSVRMHNAMLRIVQYKKLLLQHELEKISSPKQLIRSHWQSLDYLQERLNLALQRAFSKKSQALQLVLTQLQALNPRLFVLQNKQRIMYLEMQVANSFKRTIQHHKSRLETQAATLNAVSPLATLGRGYAIATEQNHVLMDSKQVNIGDTIRVQLAKGTLFCEVIENV